MDGTNWIYAYHQGIKDGTYVVGRFIRTLYDKLVQGIQEKTWLFDVKKANAAISWIENHCFHTEGPLAPGPLKLEVWQKAAISAIFGIVDEKCVRQFREVLLVVARKNGKSIIGSGIGGYSFRGGDAGYGGKTYCLAPKLEQADIIYNNIWQMTQLDPEWQKLKAEVEASKDAHNKKQIDDSMLVRHRQSDLYIPGTNSTAKKIAFSAKKSDGFNPSLTICDEIASWVGSQGLRQYEVMASAIGAREMGTSPGLLLSCSTAGYENDGIYDELMKRATAFLNGSSKEKRLLPILYIIDDPLKWDDINELRKSNPNLSVSISVNFLLDEIEKARVSLSKKSEFLTKYCNLKQSSSQAWLEFQAVEECMGSAITPAGLRSSYCVGGVDLSQTTDLTSACIVVEKQGRLKVISHFWMPEQRLDKAIEEDGVPYRAMISHGWLSLSGENYVDYRDVVEWFKRFVTEYEILPLAVGYDRYSAQYFVEEMKSLGFHMSDVRQGTNLTPVIRELDGIIKDRKIDLGDNSLLQAHMLNSALKLDEEAQKMRLVKITKRARIDGMAALLDAMCVRQADYAEIGLQLKNEG